MRICLTIGSFLLPQLALAGGSVTLTETSLAKMLQKDPPGVMEIESRFLAAKRSYLSEKDRLELSLEGSAGRNRSEEKLLSSFDGGVTKSASQYSLGLSKPTRYGVDLGVKTFGQKSTNAFIENASSVGFAMTVKMDLFQNFLGRRVNNSLKKGKLNVKRATLEKTLGLKAFESNVRKVYWSLVANKEQEKLLRNLVGLAKRQYNDSVKRKSSGVADAGEVARYRSVWSTRKASLSSLKYQKGKLVRSLQELLPELKGKEVIIGDYNVDKTVGKVLMCSSKISQRKKTPFEFTYYDEIINLIQEEEQLERKIVDTYNAPQVFLTGEYAKVGRDFSIGEARDDLSDDGRAKTSVGLQFSIPFGGAKTRTEEVTQLLNRKRYQADAKKRLLQVEALHQETAQSIMILNDVMDNQKETNKYLSQSLKISEKKYRQARISVQELISEQNSFLQSKLNEIDTNLLIINTLLDYFAVYDRFPCQLNKIK